MRAIPASASVENIEFMWSTRSPNPATGLVVPSR